MYTYAYIYVHTYIYTCTFKKLQAAQLFQGDILYYFILKIVYPTIFFLIMKLHITCVK